MRFLACALVVALVGISAQANAEDDMPGRGQDRAADAPDPDPRDADGVALPDATPTATKLQWIPRVLLFVPRWTLEIVNAPIRLGLYGYERYAVKQRLDSVFGGDGALEGYPIVHVEPGFGLSIGASLAHTNLFGHGERLRLKGGAGGMFRQFYGVKISSGRLFGDLEVTGELDLDFRGNARFSGFGNSDLADMLPADPVDATTRDVAVNTLFSQDTLRFELHGVYTLTDLLTTKVSSAHITRTFGPTDDEDDPDIAAAYDLDTLTSFGTGVEQLYSEIELIFDNRANTQSQLNVAVPNTGWKLSGFGGHALGLDTDPTRYSRFGVDIQRFTRLWNTDRILALRAYGEAITGPLDDIPFMDLPSLGGSRELRGFFSDRFRDRALGFVAAEYHFPVNLWMSSFVFTEVGRVFESVSDVTWRRARVGFGAGVQIHNRDKFLFRAHMASSNEGGLLLHLSVDPVFRQKARTKRK